MPTTTAPVSAAPAAVPAPPATTPPAAAAPPAPPAKPALGSAKEEGSRVHQLFKKLSENAPEARDDRAPKKPDTPPAEKPKDPPATPPAPAAKEKPIKAEKKGAKRPELPIPAPAAPAPVAAPVSPKPDANWEDGLLDDEKAVLEEARFASEHFPEHKDLADRTAKFLKKHAEFLEQHPDVTDDDPEYVRLLATKPELSVVERRKIMEGRLTQGVEKKYKPEIEDLRHELYVRDEEPKIRDEGQRLHDELWNTALPKEMMEYYEKHGVDQLKKDYADELTVANAVITAARDDLQEMLRITRTSKAGRPLVSIAKDESDPRFEQHMRLGTIVDKACETFKNTAPQSQQVRNGKWFVTRDEWAQIPPAQRGQYWTFTNDEKDVREMFAIAAKNVPLVIANAIDQRRKEFESRGWRRHRDTPAAPPPAAAAPAPVSSTASPRPSVVPSPTATANAPETLGSKLARQLNPAP